MSSGTGVAAPQAFGTGVAEVAGVAVPAPGRLSKRFFSLNIRHQAVRQKLLEINGRLPRVFGLVGLG